MPDFSGKIGGFAPRKGRFGLFDIFREQQRDVGMLLRVFQPRQPFRKATALQRDAVILIKQLRPKRGQAPIGVIKIAERQRDFPPGVGLIQQIIQRQRRVRHQVAVVIERHQFRHRNRQRVQAAVIAHGLDRFRDVTLQKVRVNGGVQVLQQAAGGEQGGQMVRADQRVRRAALAGGGLKLLLRAAVRIRLIFVERQGAEFKPNSRTAAREIGGDFLQDERFDFLRQMPDAQRSCERTGGGRRDFLRLQAVFRVHGGRQLRCRFLPVHDARQRLNVGVAARPLHVGKLREIRARHRGPRLRRKARRRRINAVIHPHPRIGGNALQLPEQFGLLLVIRQKLREAQGAFGLLRRRGGVEK